MNFSIEQPVINYARFGLYLASRSYRLIASNWTIKWLNRFSTLLTLIYCTILFRSSFIHSFTDFVLFWTCDRSEIAKTLHLCKHSARNLCIATPRYVDERIDIKDWKAQHWAFVGSNQYPKWCNLCYTYCLAGCHQWLILSTARNGMRTSKHDLHWMDFSLRTA